MVKYTAASASRRAPPVEPHVEHHGHGGASGEGRERRVEPAVVEHRRVDAAGQLAQLGDRRLGRGVRLGDERLRGLRIRVDLLLRHTEGHADGHEARLHAVVQVPLDAGALHVGGAHGAGALRRGGAHLLAEVEIPVGVATMPREITRCSRATLMMPTTPPPRPRRR
jgi:hypothetical protein